MNMGCESGRGGDGEGRGRGGTQQGGEGKYDEKHMGVGS